MFIRSLNHFWLAMPAPPKYLGRQQEIRYIYIYVYIHTHTIYIYIYIYIHINVNDDGEVLEPLVTRDAGATKHLKKQSRDFERFNSIYTYVHIYNHTMHIYIHLHTYISSF